MTFKNFLVFTSFALFLNNTSAFANPTLLINANSGEVLHANEATRAWYPASLTKLMTAYLVFEALTEQKLKPLTYLTVSQVASAQKPSKMGFSAGSKITVEAALHALLTKSANDIAVVLAEGISGNGPAFVVKMNRKAQELGMSGTNFVNPNGMPSEKQVTTARDMAVLARAILQNFPQYEAFFRVPGLQIGNKTVRSFNGLIGRYDGATGMKTGFICNSGFNLVASAQKNGQNLIAVVLGETTGLKRSEKAAELFDIYAQNSNTGVRVSQLRNDHDTPISMRNEVCGQNRQQPASESEEFIDTSGAYGLSAATGDFFMTKQGQSSRLAPKPASIRTVTISIEKQNTKAKKSPIYAFIDHGNGKPPLPTTQQSTKNSSKIPNIQKNQKFLPAHPTQKGIIAAPKPVKIPANRTLRRVQESE